MNYTLATKDILKAALLDARSRTLSLVEGLSEEQLLGPILPTVNPLRWEIAHVAYFHEYWVLRHLCGKQPVRADVDELFDSISIEHESRWQLPLPSLRDTYIYMNEVLQTELFQLEQIKLNKTTKYFYLLALFHEDMHDEAFTYTRQTLAYSKPSFIKESMQDANVQPLIQEDIEVAGGNFLLGAERNGEFIFDNEKWAHQVNIAPFKISKFAVSNDEYLEFVEAGGYQKERYWSDAAWKWRCERKLNHPEYWMQDSDQNWYVRQFDQWKLLQAKSAVIHISWYEAQAFCKWANRRLPTEAEWEFAAACDPNENNNGITQKRIFPWGNEWRADYAITDSSNMGPIDVDEFPGSDSAYGCRQMIGNVWEWTDTTFQPYPGFSPDWYAEYSRPLFGVTKVLRGGAWTSRGRMLRNTWRNYYGPDRNDVFAGFRTCAL